MSDLILHTDREILDDLLDENADRMRLVQKKIKKPYAAINSLTGVVVKRFKKAEKLARFLHTPRETSLGNLSPQSFFVRGYMITQETDETLEVQEIEWVAK